MSEFDEFHQGFVHLVTSMMGSSVVITFTTEQLATEDEDGNTEIVVAGMHVLDEDISPMNLAELLRNMADELEAGVEAQRKAREN